MPSSPNAGPSIPPPRNGRTPDPLPSPTISISDAAPPHPLETLSRSTAHIFGDGLSIGIGIAEGMPTRPSLRRALEGSFAGVAGEGGEGLWSRSRTNSTRESMDGSREGSDGGEAAGGKRGGENGRAGVEVIVHEVQSTDSLEGLALKYGVPLASLRRTNKLWPSDPIHLRRTLYIPLPQSRPAPQLQDSQSTIRLPFAVPTPSESADSLLLPSPPGGPEERRVVPHEELSFFPPPTGTTVGTVRSPAPRLIPPNGNMSNGLPNPSPSGSPRPHTLVDLFRSLPDISTLGRRSVESVLSVGSTREEGAEGKEGGKEVEMEMDERRERRYDEPMRPSEGMVVRRGGGRGSEDEDEDW